MYEIAVFGAIFAVIAGGAATAWLLARHQRGTPAASLGLFMLAMTVWSATHLGTLLSGTLQWQLAFTQLSYVGVVAAPLLWLVFAVRYAGRDEWLSVRRLGALSVVPAVTLLLVFTAQHHGVFYADTWMTTVDGHPLLGVESGPWYVLAVLYSYVLLLVGTGVLFAAALSDNPSYRRQSTVLLGAVTVPWMVNVTYNLGFRPIPWIDPTPIAFVVGGIPLAVIVVGSDLGSHLPVAHERVVRTLEDPILVVAPDGTVVDANRAARTVLGSGDPLDGTTADDLLPEALPVDGPGDRPVGPVECTVVHEGEQRTYLARHREIDPERRGPARGAVVRLTDVTLQRRQRASLERQNERLAAQTDRLERKNDHLERLADVVAHDLRGPLSTATKLTTLLQQAIDEDRPAEHTQDRPAADTRDRTAEPTQDRTAVRALEDLRAVHERLERLASDLPRLAREGMDVESTEPCDLEAVATEAWTAVDSGDVTLDVESSRRVRADPRRLGQVFENLFRNAVEHGRPGGDGAWAGATDPRSTDGGCERSEEREDPVEGAGRHRWQAGGEATVGEETGGEATVGEETGGEATVGEETGGEVVTTVRVGVTDRGFYVADDGPGVPAAVRDDLFEYGASTGDGTGYGLAIVRAIVEAHGWAIEADDVTSGGARFDVTVGGGPPP